MFVWGYGILGKGPELEHSDVPTMIPEPVFGRNEVQPDTTVVDIECGLGHFVALTGKFVVVGFFCLLLFFVCLFLVGDIDVIIMLQQYL